MTDWLPSLLSLAGYNVTKLKDLDGLDVWGTLSSNASMSPRCGVQLSHISAKRVQFMVNDFVLVNAILRQLSFYLMALSEQKCC